MSTELRYIPGNLIHGPQVRRIQEDLLALGFDVGSHGADGWYGKDTAEAVKAFQASRSFVQTGEMSDFLRSCLEQALLLEAPTPGLPSLFINRRGKHDPPSLYSASRSPRSWSDIKGVTLHQTGCVLGDTPKRWDTVSAHIGVLSSGRVVLLNSFLDFIWHGQLLSFDTIGIEINGNYPGLEGDPSTLWKGGGGPSHLNPGMRDALDQLFDVLVDLFKHNGATWEVIRCHRQGYVNRRADPGPEIYREVAIPWAAKLGIDLDPDWTIGDGRPIPEAWGGSAGVPY